MILDNVFENVPYLVLCSVNHLSCALYIVGKTACNKLLHYERLEQLDSHFLGKSALIHFQVGSYNDNGTSGVVNTLTEQVLTETSLLALKHIGK